MLYETFKNASYYRLYFRFSFLYCLLVLIGIGATPYIANEKVRAVIVLALPFLFLKRKTIKKTNNLFHKYIA